MNTNNMFINYCYVQGCIVDGFAVVETRYNTYRLCKKHTEKLRVHSTVFERGTSHLIQQVHFVVIEGVEI